MPEPTRSRLRLMTMKRVSLAVALLVLAGCGSAADEGGSDGGAAPSPSESVAVCAHGTDAARRVTTADLDGDGTPEELLLQPAAGAECPPALVAEIGPDSTTPRGVVADLPTDEPPVTSAFAVAVPGRSGELVVTRQDHPRGGFQTRVFALAGEEFAQLQVEGRPLVPFVATDVQEHPVSVDCGDNLITVTEAVAHEPAGVMFAWDIKQTTYALQGVTVTPGPTTEIADNVLPATLKQKFPELGKNAVFPSCRVR